MAKLQHKKQALMALDSEILVDALLELADRSKSADNLIERLIAPPKKNIQRFRKKLAALKTGNQFFDWREAPDFENDLSMLLQDLTAAAEDPLTGIELLIEFYESDQAIMEMCDDSDGYIGEIFCYDAKNLFIDYAKQCQQKDEIADLLTQLMLKDDYGVRDSLIDSAKDYLPDTVIRSMIDKFQYQADLDSSESGKRHHLMMIELLARQIKDAELFKNARIASWGTLSTAAFIDIAEVYFDSGDVETAHSWIKKISKDDYFQADKRDQLLLKIYNQQGSTKKLAELLYQKFRSYRSIESLEKLLDVIGQHKRNEVLETEVSLIAESSTLSITDAEFLMTIEKIDEAEEYLLKRADQLNGRNYVSLPDLANKMETKNRYLVASLIYRNLLNSILERGYTKAYSHGIRYLKKCDWLANKITAWQVFENHEAFKQQLYQKHSRKRSFWSMYPLKK